MNGKSHAARPTALEMPAKSHIDKLSFTALSFIESLLSQFRNNVLAYSGGKDSRVLAHLMTQLTQDQTAVCDTSWTFKMDRTSNEAFAKSAGLQVFYNERLGRDYLVHNPDVIFCDLKHQAKIYALQRHATIREYAQYVGADVVFLGRRNQENSVKSELYQIKSGIYHCCPLRTWRTDEIWAYIHYHGLPVSPLYDTPIGIEGASPWALLSNTNLVKFGFNAFDLVNEYEPEIMDWLASWWAPAQRYRKDGYFEGLL